ncbi:kinase-like protein, partial [Exidia glandulosa HHB12029]
EISLWGRVSHRNLQRLLGVCYVPTSPLPAMVSEWHANGDITSYLKSKAHDPELQEIKYRLVSQYKYWLHENDIVHGDIKGANVLISNDGSARLSDFGFSMILTEYSRSRSQWSAAKGTIRWMAPEFFDEDDRVATHTRASDVWAIGCLIIEVCS